MPAFKLPRLQWRLAIVDNQGRPTTTFLDFFNNQFATKLEAQEALQSETIAALEAQQTVIAAQQEQIVEALQLANIAIGLTGGNAGSDTITMDIIGDSWQAGPQVDLTGVVAGDVSIPGSGFFADAGTDQNFTNLAGEVRLVEIDGGDTVIGGPWAFTSVKDTLFNTVYVNNPSAINSFTDARTTTGAISYRLDVRMNEPTWQITDVPVRLYARRTT